MALSLRAKNLLVGGGLATFAGSVFAYTVFQMNKVRVRDAPLPMCDDFDDLDDIVKVNAHQSGAIKATPVKKECDAFGLRDKYLAAAFKDVTE